MVTKLPFPVNKLLHNTVSWCLLDLYLLLLTGECVTTTTQSMSTPISASPAQLSSTTYNSTDYNKQHPKSDDTSQDESSQDSIKFKSDMKRDVKQVSLSLTFSENSEISV